jgi:hypothetical protein
VTRLSEPADLKRSGIVKRTIVACGTSFGMILGLAASTNPYDPAQRFVGGGLLGAGAGAAIGAAAGGRPGAALGPQSAGPRVQLEASPPRPHHDTATIMDTPAITAIPAITVFTVTKDSDGRCRGGRLYHYAAATIPLPNPRLLELPWRRLRPIDFNEPVG